jgi:PAT family beta-lactamase induction signal transducer AmpG
MLVCVFLGISSGLPLYIFLNLIQAWLKTEQISIKDIGLFALVQMPYIWKFLWAPLLDRYELPILSKWLGAQRAWMLLMQTFILVLIVYLGFLNPREDLSLIFFWCCVLAFLSATQDIVLDAYRKHLLSETEQGLGTALFVNAYKLSGFIPGSLSLILADNNWSWSSVFMVTALFMGLGLVGTCLAPHLDLDKKHPRSLRDAVIQPFIEFFSRGTLSQAIWILLFLFFYKLGDALAVSLATTFYLDLGFTKTQIALIAKNAGLWPSIVGGLVGGIWMLRLGVNRSLWVFGVIQAVVILGFWLLAAVGNAPWVLAIVIGLEAFGVGLGTTALVTFIARETSSQFSATQFALFSSLATLPRVVVSSYTGFLVDSLGGWKPFFILCFFLAIPGMLLLFKVAPWNEVQKETR